MFAKSVLEKIKTHFMFNNPLPPQTENRGVCEIMCKNAMQATNDNRAHAHLRAD